MEIRGSARRGRRARDWQRWSHSGELSWRWDGLEPLQNPPGPQEGRLREPSLQAFLRELAAFNPGLCVISTRLSVADIADHEGVSHTLRLISNTSPAMRVQSCSALSGLKDLRVDLRSASDEFDGHCLALTLLGSYLTDAYKGDIRCRKEVSGHLPGDDIRQGVHARKVMKSYPSRGLGTDQSSPCCAC